MGCHKFNCEEGSSGEQHINCTTTDEDDGILNVYETAFPTVDSLTISSSHLSLVKLPTEESKNDSPEMDSILSSPELKGLHWRRAVSFVGGREALRRAVKEVSSAKPHRWKKNDRGAPVLPDTVMGSIAHKGDFAVGAAMLRGQCLREHIGVDIEYTSLKRDKEYMNRFAHRILTGREVRSLGHLDGIGVDEEVLLRFSIKEALYKSIDPELRRHVPHKEVEVQPFPCGSVEITNLLSTPKIEFSSNAIWKRYELKSSSAQSFWLSWVHSYSFSS